MHGGTSTARPPRIPIVRRRSFIFFRRRVSRVWRCEDVSRHAPRTRYEPFPRAALVVVGCADVRFAMGMISARRLHGRVGDINTSLLVGWVFIASRSSVEREFGIGMDDGIETMVLHIATTTALSRTFFAHGRTDARTSTLDLVALRTDVTSDSVPGSSPRGDVQRAHSQPTYGVPPPPTF